MKQIVIKAVPGKQRHDCSGCCFLRKDGRCKNPFDDMCDIDSIYTKHELDPAKVAAEILRELGYTVEPENDARLQRVARIIQGETK